MRRTQNLEVMRDQFNVKETCIFVAEKFAGPAAATAAAAARKSYSCTHPEILIDCNLIVV
jgi:hypothetical protein